MAQLLNEVSNWPSGATHESQRATKPLSSSTLLEVNRKLMATEQALTNSEGLPRRPWYKHMIYAPGVYSGYDAKTIPAVREAIEQKHWDEANSEIIRVSTAVEAESRLIQTSTDLLGK